MVGGQHDVEVAVVVEIAVRARRGRRSAVAAPAPGCGGDVLELLLPEVAEQVRRLRIRDARLHAFDVVGDVAVGGRRFEPAVEVVVEEEAAEGQRQQTTRGRYADVGASSMNRPVPSLW